MRPKALARIFPLGPDSRRQPGVPRGRVEQRHFNHSRIFPGTERDYWIYVPAQYRASRPACLLVVQDGRDHLLGERWDMAAVLDNLIHQRAMPVTIGVFINPGKIPAARAGAQPRDNRSFEYDSMDGRYARFLLEELLPGVERDYRLRRDGNSRAIMGGSSGGFCAFNVAWERPDRFQRVVSMVGSFTPMRGGHAMSSRVRLTAPKPLRVFLEGGAQDLNLAYGDWWTANLGMLSALRFAGYAVQHAWHKRAGHNAYHPSMVCPDALRWVWRGYPKPVRAARNVLRPITRVFAPQRDWREVTKPGAPAGALPVEAGGQLGLADRCEGMVRRLAADGAEQLYWTEHGRVMLRSGPKRRVATTAVRSPRLLALTADAGQMLIASACADHVALATIQPDGTLSQVEPYFRLNTDEGPAAREVTAMAVARPGWVVIATKAGLQLNHTNGLVAGFMPLPGDDLVCSIVLAGPKRDRLYVSCGGRIFCRRIQLLPNLWF